MNERIKELAEQSTIYVTGFPILDEQKFAELIVRECADYVQFYYKDHSCEVIANDMKTHFGVEK